MKILEIKKLSKNFHNKEVLNDINIEIESGKIYGLLGVNASGKTTLIGLINNLLIPTRGEILFNGERLGTKSKERIAYLPENSLFMMRVLESVKWHQYFFEGFKFDRAIELLEKYEISLKDRVSTLSRGTYEKLILILTLCRDADIYVLDEPLSGVDIIAREELIDLILDNYNPNSAMIISTHIISEVERLFDHVIIINKGKVLLDENADALREKQDTSIENIFKEVIQHEEVI
ncbi:ABC transporter ATP-binding protein [Haploplasma axanthum]|uniref:ABC transporter, ATP-binding protein n=1 Tax=Haploplasma axanthum TaxID=29552 RepID=A0A449BBK9_HAPAX|nr:ABC transporter ATP-binding protein [Haploplasma axanthum]VEU79809.1 ABC transporter, ATP-binding protein [Haploplasma axanthum]